MTSPRHASLLVYGLTAHLSERGYLGRKLAAHRSAFGATQEMLSDPPPGVSDLLRAFRPVLEREVFLLGGTRIAAARWPLQDFFDGM